MKCCRPLQWLWCGAFRRGLKAQFQAQFYDTRVACTEDSGEVAAGKRGIRVAETGVVEDVEELAAKLDLQPLGGFEVAVKTEVQIVSARGRASC